MSAFMLLLRMFPSVPLKVDSFEEKCKDNTEHVETEFKFRHTVFGVRSPFSTNKCLLVGKHGSGRTSLLFQCALSSALDGQQVVLITHSRFQSMPLCVHGAPSPDPLLMKQIQILYYQDRPTLLHHLASIHTNPIQPDVLIVDDLDFYVSHPKTQDPGSTTAMLCAYLVDAATFIDTSRNKKTQTDGCSEGCLVMASVSTTSSGEVALEHVYSKFLPTILNISGIQGATDVYQLSLQSNGATQTCTITYEIKDNIRLLDYNVGGATFGMSQDFSQE